MEACDVDGERVRQSGPILCVCGRPAPGQAGRPLVRVGGVPWGFCSWECYEDSVDRFCEDAARVLPGLRRYGG